MIHVWAVILTCASFGGWSGPASECEPHHYATRDECMAYIATLKSDNVKNAFCVEGYVRNEK